MQKRENALLRAELFRHLDGLVVAPTAFALHEKGVLTYFLEKKEATLDELTARFQANDGYLNVALRMLCSQGWLRQTIDNQAGSIRFSLTEAGAIALPLAPIYADVSALLKMGERYHARRFELEPFRALKRIFEKYVAGYGLPTTDDPVVAAVHEQILKHVEGIIVGPTAVRLGMSGMFHKYFMEASFRPEEFHKDGASFHELLDMFSRLGWFLEKNGTYRFTEKGLFMAQRASAYGVTVSYIPTLRHVDELIFGNPNRLRDLPPGAPEAHVDREMNVWGSGGAHASYFKKVDEVIIGLFNRPIEEQPRGILDMGCGNGAFLKHLFEVIERSTRRGQMLDEYPLFLVGADFNDAALRVARHNLIQADIWAKVIFGDIGRPDLLAADLLDDYGIRLEDLLNTRTFLDHNRIWEPPTEDFSKIESHSTGAFAHRGRRLPNAAVEQSLAEHLQKWTPFVGKHGLLLIELHTIAPELAAANPGRTAATAYDATHGFSDQYILEIDAFRRAAERAGLRSDDRFFSRFPDSELATVSIHLFQKPA